MSLSFADVATYKDMETLLEMSRVAITALWPDIPHSKWQLATTFKYLQQQQSELNSSLYDKFWSNAHDYLNCQSKRHPGSRITRVSIFGIHKILLPNSTLKFLDNIYFVMRKQFTPRIIFGQNKKFANLFLETKGSQWT